MSTILSTVASSMVTLTTLVLTTADAQGIASGSDLTSGRRS